MKIQYFHWWCPRAKGWGGGGGRFKVFHTLYLSRNIFFDKEIFFLERISKVGHAYQISQGQRVFKGNLHS